MDRMQPMLTVLKKRIIHYISEILVKVKWVLILVNTLLFYIVFQHALYIGLSMGRYAIYFWRGSWIYQSQWSFLVACGIAAIVFLGVAWRSMAAPISVLQMTSLVAAPVAFYYAFGELIYAMV